MVSCKYDQPGVVRLGTDPLGRPVAVISVRTLPDVELGYRYVVLGDTIAAGA